MLIVLQHLCTDVHTNNLDRRLVPVTFVRRWRCGFWRYYGKGGVNNGRCGKWMSELWRNGGIAGQGDMKTGHEAVKSQVTANEARRYAPGSVLRSTDRSCQWCSLALHLPSCHREGMVCKVPAVGMWPQTAVVRVSCMKVRSYFFSSEMWNIRIKSDGRSWERNLYLATIVFPLLAFRIILTPCCSQGNMAFAEEVKKMWFLCWFRLIPGATGSQMLLKES